MTQEMESNQTIYESKFLEKLWYDIMTGILQDEFLKQMNVQNDLTSYLKHLSSEEVNNVPGKDGEKFEITFDESWHKIPRKEFDTFIDIITMNAINKEALEKEWEEKKKNLDKYITQSPTPSREYSPSCGERYERENNKEEE